MFLLYLIQYLHLHHPSSKMKINPVFFILSLLVTLVFSYASFVFCHNNFKLLYTILGSIGILMQLTVIVSANYNNPRLSINLKTFSSIFFIINLIILMLFINKSSQMEVFIITYILYMTIYIGVAYSIYKTKV